MRFTWHIFLRSLLVRKSRSLTSLAAVTVAATIATALLNLYASTHTGISREFRAFGANVVINAESVDLAAVKLLPGESAVPLAYTAATTDSGQPVVLVGTDLAALLQMNTAWKATRSSGGNAIVGKRVFARGDFRSVTANSARLPISVAKVITSGDADESRVFVSLEDLRKLVPNAKIQTVMVAIPGDPAHIQARVQELRTSLPRYSVEPMRSIIETQSGVLSRMQSVMVLSTLLISTIAALSLWASLSASVLERRRDFAVLKALGASNASVSLMFLMEQGAVAMIGALLGYVLGCALSALITYSNFHLLIAPRLQVFPWILMVAAGIVLVGSMLPLARLQKIQPAAILKGE
jgi:putative ABC transport system permease protein